MRHKKIPSANRKKLKQVDPFNRQGAALRKKEKQKYNNEPKGLDDQPLTRAQLELEEIRKNINVKQPKNKKKQNNKVLEEAKRAGLVKGRFEGMQQFIVRVMRTLTSEIQEHSVKVKQGTAAKPQAELDADMKILEDREKKQKDQKKREIQNKINAARKERERREAIEIEKAEAKGRRQQERKERELRELEQSEQEAMQELEDLETGDNKADGENEESGKNEDEEDALQIQPAPYSKEPKKVLKSQKPAKRAERAKEAKESLRQTKHLDHLLNSKEVIGFGERCDAPPVFAGVFKKAFDPLNAKAGGKNLLLHTILKKETGIKTQYLEDESKAKPSELDRLKVIEAYRDLKRKRNALARM